MADSFVELRFDPSTVALLQDQTFLARFNRESAHIASAIVLFFSKRAQAIAGSVTRDYLSGQRLKRRTGSLARAVVGVGGLFRSQEGAQVPALRVGVFRGPASRYAAIQELGTKGKNPKSPFPDIVPKKAQALAIPVGEALTPAGVHRYESPRQYPRDLTFVPFRRGISQGGFTPNSEQTGIGGLYETQSLVKDIEGEYDLSQAKLAYLLVAKVALEAKYYLRDAFEAQLPRLTRALADYLAQILSLGPEARPEVAVQRFRGGL